MNLPETFLERMKTQLGQEYTDFIASYDEAPSYGLRINLLKGAVETILPALPFDLKPVPWAKEGFEANAAQHPGKHVLHEAGVYYIQEPSAMSVVSLLQPMPGERILDLCAAPGGKSTQIAARMQGKGLLVSNEIIPGRAKILSQNIERMGVANAIVCNESPDRIAGHFPLFFNRIVVDAPCSGEGMFRKDETAITEWSDEQVDVCAKRQEMILEYADTMLKPGGILVYSTCTFAPEEDEKQMSHFLDTHPEYSIQPWSDFLPNDCGIVDGTLPGTARLFPHNLHGEGHFAVRLQKGNLSDTAQDKDTAGFDKRSSKKNKKGKAAKTAAPDLSNFEAFMAKYVPKVTFDTTRALQYFGDELYLLPPQLPSLQGLKLCRAGLHLGTRKKNRFEPSYALAKTLSPEQVTAYYDCEEDEALRYLHGDALTGTPLQQGWVLVCYKHFPLGWAKATNGTLKNHYPKGLRIQF